MMPRFGGHGSAWLGEQPHQICTTKKQKKQKQKQKKKSNKKEKEDDEEECMT
jgi:hypothetical protein